MRLLALVSAMMLASTWANAEAVFEVPSGQPIEFYEKLDDKDSDTLRLRFLAPDLASPLKRPSFEELTVDLETLCTEFGLKNIAQNAAPPKQIVVSLSAQPVEFGVANADIEQVFEAFSVENDTCMLEMF